MKNAVSSTVSRATPGQEKGQSVQIAEAPAITAVAVAKVTTPVNKTYCFSVSRRTQRRYLATFELRYLAVLSGTPFSMARRPCGCPELRGIGHGRRVGVSRSRNDVRRALQRRWQTPWSLRLLSPLRSAARRRNARLVVTELARVIGLHLAVKHRASWGHVRTHRRQRPAGGGKNDSGKSPIAAI